MSAAVETLTSAALFTTPLLIAAGGELVVERAGIVNIGVEGMMLTGALAAFVTTAHLAPAMGPGTATLIGIVAAIVAAMLLGLLFAGVVIPLGADQIVAGTGINLLALGGTAFGFKALSASLPASIVSSSAAGPWYMAMVSLLIIGGAWFYLRLMRAGLELTAIGEAPYAADAAGISVGRKKLIAILVGAACAGLAGSYLSTLRVLSFQENMTEGQGFLALAIVIFGRWHPLSILAAAIFFGLVRAVAIEAEAEQGLLYPPIRWMLSQVSIGHRAALFDAIKAFLKALPYVVTLIALAGVAGRPGAPAALGRPYRRE